jgi:acyl-CoA reductase-like NAD-dependent aldehyde dehydrogenase
MAGTVQKEYQHFINGSWQKSGSGKTLDVMNPAKGEVLTRVQAGDARDVDAAVAAARDAFVSWGKTSPMERQRILLEIAHRIEKRAKDYAAWESQNVGKPIRESSFIDVPFAVDHFRYSPAFCATSRAPRRASTRPCSTSPCGSLSGSSGTFSPGTSRSCSWRGNSPPPSRPGTPW